MRRLFSYITGRVKHLPPGEMGLIVFDIDDTLLRADPTVIKVYKKVHGEPEMALTTAEFAVDPDAAEHPDWFDYRDFHDPEKVYQSIVRGTPVLRNLRIMDAYINAGYDFCFLTARGCEEVIKTALRDFLRYKDQAGVLQDLADSYKESLSAAINDSYKHYRGRTDAEKKANVLSKLCDDYDRVVFVDDDPKNVAMARQLDLDNLTVINAWK